MDPDSSLAGAGRGPVAERAGRGVPEVIVGDPAWRRMVPRLDALVQRAARLAGGAGTVLLTSDAEVRRLNARYRGRDKPTNVLTFDSGDMALASGVVRREATASGKRVVDHLLHLVVHGALHLRGEDHARPSEARRMEMREARLLHRLGVANPWRFQ